MARTGRSFEHMARMRSRRGLYSDPRDGRALRQIRRAFAAEDAAQLSTTALLCWCDPHPHLKGEVRPWHRTNVAKAAFKVAAPIGRAKTRWRPVIWQAVPELMDQRSPIGDRGAARQSARGPELADLLTCSAATVSGR